MIPISQNRIDFTPTPEEIAGVSLAHIHQVRKAIVSFGQGCEGDPLMVADVIESAIRNIRSETVKGTIHMNTNAGIPNRIRRLVCEMGILSEDLMSRFQRVGNGK